MTLSAYIHQQGGSGTLSCPVVARIAAAAGCSAGTLYMIALGHKAPGAKLAGRISDAVGGQVTRETLRPDVFKNKG